MEPKKDTKYLTEKLKQQNAETEDIKSLKKTDTKYLTEKLKQQNAKTEEIKSLPTIEVNTITLNRITSDEWYRYEDVMPLGRALCRKCEYNDLEHFRVIGSITELENNLKEYGNETNVYQKSLFIIYNKDGNHWVTFCITESNDRIKLLYKDSFCQLVPEDLRNSLLIHFSNKIDFLSNGDSRYPDQEDGTSCGCMALMNMNVMMKGIMKNKEKFIADYAYIQFCKQKEVSTIKTDFKLDLVKHAIQKELQDVNINDEFRDELKKFIACAIDMETKLSKPTGDYRRILEEECRKLENESDYQMDHKKINEARLKVASNVESISKKIEQVEKSIKIIAPGYKEGMVPMNEQSQGNIDVDSGSEMSKESEVKFETTYKKFLSIIKMLNGMEVTEELNKLLDDIGNKFGLETDILHKFFEMQKIDASTSTKNEKGLQKIQSIHELVKNLPKKTSKQHHDRSTEKPLEQILAEVSFGMDKYTRIPNEDASNLDRLSPGERISFYKAKYESVPEALELKSKIIKIKEYLKEWENKDLFEINKWAIRHKRVLGDNDILEAIAIMDRANYLLSGGYHLRDVQILSLLIFLDTKPNQGKLCQINTGEGKTIIASLLAVIKVLQGEVVDIMTSNQVLAEEGVKERGRFYTVFGITFATNNNEANKPSEGSRECYKADVVYGTISNFQFDYLRDSLENYCTRSGRKFGCAILDEVDNMTIDNGNYIAKLAGPFPGMDYLKFVYIKIWTELCKAERELFGDFEEELLKKSKFLRDRGNLSQNEPDRHLSEIFNKLKTEIKNKILASDPASIEIIPYHLKQYCVHMISTWIDNAFHAKYQCEENEEYVIRQKQGEDVVIPVDYQNTGITLQNTMWCNGLHQFIQLKHNLRLTAENLTSCFISNIGYIKLYNSNIFGMTGTLGSIAEQELLSEIYSINYSKIPPFKESNFQEMEGVVVKDDHWANLIAIYSLALIHQGRSVLIICKTIKDLLKIEENILALKKLRNNKLPNIRTYADEDSSSIVDVEIGPFEIIIATNIAGRGTDFKTSSKLENNGGLHVCVAFIPYNRRVEDQAFGRTSRQGNHGTAQIIGKESDVLELNVEIQPGMSFYDIKEKRDFLEKLRLDSIKNEKLIEIDFQDRLFSKFSDLYKEFKNDQMKILGGYFLIEDLKEYWAHWLHKKEFNGPELLMKEVELEFENFQNDAKDILVTKKIKLNPYYCIKQAEYFLNYNEIEKAELALNNAISLCEGNSELLHSAYMRLFEVAIEKGGQVMERLKKAIGQMFFIKVTKDEKYKEKAKGALEKAIKGLEKEINYMKNNFFDLNVPSTEDGEGHHRESSYVADFQEILIKKKENLLVKHLSSRFIALDTFLQHAVSLSQQITDIPDTKGICINIRMPKYLKNLDSKQEEEKKLKEALTEAELSELESLGLETFYELREVHDVPKKVIDRAQIQIGAGIASLAAGALYPPIMIVTGQMGSTLIAEGICDIVFQLIRRGDAEFDEAAYLKCKCITYGISLMTMGIGVISKCQKILRKAIQACKTILQFAELSPNMKFVFRNVITYIELLICFLEKFLYVTEFLRKSLNEKMIDYLSSAVLCRTYRQIVMATMFKGSVSLAVNVALTQGNTLRWYKSKLESIPKAPQHSKSSEKGKRSERKQQETEFQDQNTKTEEEVSKPEEDANSMLKTFTDVLEAYDVLRLHPNASKENFVTNFNGYIEKTGTCEEHDYKYQEKISKAREAYDIILESQNLLPNSSCQTSNISCNQSNANEKDAISDEYFINSDGSRKAHQGNIETLSYSFQQHIVLNIHTHCGTVVREFGTEFKGEVENAIYLDYLPGNEEQDGHFSIPDEVAKLLNVEVTSTGVNNCLYDALVPQFQARGFDVSTEDLRDIAEIPNVTNDFYDAMKNASELFKNPVTINIYHNTRNVILIGGRKRDKKKHIRNHKMDKNYPSGRLNIIVDYALTDVIAVLVNYLNHRRRMAENFDVFNMGRSDRQYLQHNKQFPIFGSNFDHRGDKLDGMMIGALRVKFTNGSTYEILAVSGDFSFCIKQQCEINGTDIVLKDPVPLCFEDRNFVLVNQGKPTGKVYDVCNREEKKHMEYSSCCAAQKLLYLLGKYMQNNPKLEIQGCISMFEYWYSFTESTMKSGQIIAEESCELCKNVLPCATGEDDEYCPICKKGFPPGHECDKCRK